jgi:uncharacterized RmlC-like cupin family protein
VVRIIKPADRDSSTAQTPGMRREAAISELTAGSAGLWMGIAANEPGGISGAHHHGKNESGIYILKGRLRFRWGEKLEHEAVAEPGDFIFVPPFEVHLEENMDTEHEAEFLLARNGLEGIVVNVPDPR